VRRLYYHFKPDFWYWVLIILGRKFLIAITALMFNKNPAFQMSFALLVLFIAYALQVRYSPYMSMSERDQVLVDHRRRAALGDPIHTALASTIAASKRTGRRAGVATSMEKQRATARMAAVSFFWNYNTVESVLLFSAVLVNLAGVMFESGRFDSGLYEQQKQFLTWVVILIIAVSIIYFFVVLFSEVYTMCTAEAKQKKAAAAPAAKGAKGKKRVVDAMSAAEAEVSSEGVFNPLFKLAAQGENAGGNVDTSSFAALIAMQQAPNSSQWAAIREACAAMMRTNQQLQDDLKSAKKTAQAVSVARVVVGHKSAALDRKKSPARRQFVPTTAETSPSSAL
jgi:hypothetical protein